MPLHLSEIALVPSIFHPTMCLLLGNKQWTHMFCWERHYVCIWWYVCLSQSFSYHYSEAPVIYRNGTRSKVGGNDNKLSAKRHHIWAKHLSSAIIIMYIRYIMFDLHAQIGRKVSFSCKLLGNNSQHL